MKKVTVLLLFGPNALAQSITDVPQCAQNCLSNSTTMQTACQIVDLRCLCTNSVYVNTLSCCLATNCNTADQQKAIAFNQAECDSVNETAPGFVGCSPISLSSLVLVGGSGTTTETTAPATSNTVSMSMATSSDSNDMVTTITGSTASGLASFSAISTIAATYTPNTLLTGSCTVPHFAIVTGTTGLATEYPEVGCSPERPGCCPFPYAEKAVLPECPLDYFTTSGNCCPTGYQIYSTTIGAETPCYTIPAVTLVPGSTPTMSSLTLITEHVFTKMYTLAGPHHGLSTGTTAGIIGGSVNAVLFLIGIAFLIVCIRRRRKRKAEPLIPRNREMSEPELTLTPSPRPFFELASPQRPPTSPAAASARSDWPIGNGNSTNGPSPAPPAYEDARSRAPALASVKPPSPQELPGSTYIYEHHRPALGADGTLGQPHPHPPPPTTSAFTEGAASSTSPPLRAITPATPPKSPGGLLDPRSPAVSPQSAVAGPESAVSPLGSPRQI